MEQWLQQNGSIVALAVLIITHWIRMEKKLDVVANDIEWLKLGRTVTCPHEVHSGRAE